MAVLLQPKDFFFFASIDVEEWFASKLITTNERQRVQETDIVEPMNSILDMFDRLNIRGTFFYVYRTAVKYPQLVQEVLRRGHEVALHGEDHNNILDLGNSVFQNMLDRMRTAFRNDFGVDLKGYRAPHFGVNKDLSQLLYDHGFLYDSSVVPSIPIPGWYGTLSAPVCPYQQTTGLWEFPIAVHPILRIPGGGGYYFRILGSAWVRHVLRSLLRHHRYAMFYIHPWELSDHNPKDTDAPAITFYRTGSWTRIKLEELLRQFRSNYPTLHCVPIAEALKILA